MTPYRLPTHWLNNRSLQFKAVGVVGSLLLVFVITATLFLINQREVQHARQWSAHTTEVSLTINELLVSALRQQIGIRGYALTTERHYKNSFETGQAAFFEHLRTLQIRVADSPEQQARLEQIAQLQQLWQVEFAQVLLDLPDSSHRLQTAAEIVRSGRGKALMDDIRLQGNEMLAVERSLQQLRDAALDRSIRNIRYLAVAMLISAVALALLFLVGIQHMLVGPMNRLTALIGRLTGGDLDVGIPYTERGDELGAIALALERFRHTAQAVQQREWVKTHASALSARLSQEQSFGGFADRLLNELCPLLGAGYGAVLRHLPEESGLERIGEYGGIGQARAEPHATRIDDGLPMQCARTGQPITLSVVPDDYLTIRSATGSAQPACVMLWPLPGLDSVAGVLELASFQPLSPRQQELMAEVIPTIGLTLEALTQALRTRELLEEAQVQSEELQASEESLRNQQEELRAANDALAQQNQALEEQGQRLRVSEEELRIQSDELRSQSQALSEFNQRLQAVQKELEEKNADLQQTSRYKSEFLANMSHELRTPLNSLLILSKDLADNRSGNLDPDQIEAAHIIHEGGQSLLGLINDILDLSKIEAGQMSVQWESVDLPQIQTQLERRFRPLARERGLNLSFTHSVDAPTQLHSDAAKLLQILTNLIGNAIKFTHHGSVRVELSVVPAESAAQTRWVRFSVVDTGIGIAADRLPHLFGAFVQADGSTSRRYGGTGLGLSISRSLAQMLGGDIDITSTPGQGSCFTLRLPETVIALPVATPPVAAEAEPPIRLAGSESPRPVNTAIDTAAPGRPATPTGNTVLIIEDDPVFTHILAEMAQQRGYRALTAATGAAGLALALHERPQGILLDVGLPDTQGWAIMEQLKADPLTAHIPVHFITATDDAERGLALGAAGFLTKPASREAIHAAFARIFAADPQAGQRILLIDADADAAAQLQALLVAQGLTVATAANIQAGLTLFAQDRYDGIVLEPCLPDGTGLDFLQRASAVRELPPVVVYAAQALSDEQTLQWREYTDSIIVKSSQPPSRLLDEVSLFLHAVRRPAILPIATAEQPLDLSGRSALVVDDDMRNVFALSKVLRAQGVTVIVAQDGRKALAQLEQHPHVDWVLMDIMMPEMDGYEATREIRSNPQWQNLPIIALTAKAMAQDRDRCLAAGASDYLPKPVDIERLLSLLRAWATPR
ncbi:response regulator [Sinimarinibacterium sp. NLF-5-8]|uniref:response regulator n=1 Tax=Sinimarinibacterium sp. NLF-5-8 TaxID=2698684 RepID=UPI00137BE218|nr:response regulator [Sinimarinibacterium sp. NLF-5-8]QHS09567.1 response regulator [Sinimarinibacterium sp. NLF-5-8]